MGLFSKKKNQPLTEEEIEKQKYREQKYYEYGQHLAEKYHLAKKIERANTFYGKHPKMLAIGLISFFLAVFILGEVVRINKYSDPNKVPEEVANNVKEDPSSFGAMNSALEKVIDNGERSRNILSMYKRSKVIKDSLLSLPQLTEKDSLLLQQCNQIEEMMTTKIKK